MGHDRNGRPCPHNVTEIDPDTDESYCVECGDVVDSNSEEDDADSPF